MIGHMTVYGSFYQNDQYHQGWVITYIQKMQRACGYLHCPASILVKYCESFVKKKKKKLNMCGCVLSQLAMGQAQSSNGVDGCRKELQTSKGRGHYERKLLLR